MIKILFFLLLIFAYCTHINNKGYIAFYSTLQKGHLFPLRGIARELNNRGYRTSFAIPHSYMKFFEGISTELIPLNITPYIEDPSVREMYSHPERRNLIDEMWHGIDGFYNMSFETFSHVYPIYKRDKPDLIVTDYMSFGGHTLAELLGIPHVVNIPIGFLFPLPGYIDYNYDHTLEPKESKFVIRLFNFLFKIGFIDYIVIPIVLYKVNRFRWSLGLQSLTYDDIFMKPMMIHQSSFALIKARTLPPNYRMTGPCLLPLKALPEDLKRYLDEAPNVIFVSLGTIAVLEEGKAEKLVQAFQKMNRYRFLWALSTNQRNLLPKNLPVNLRIESFVPQLEILAHPSVLLFISHAGFGGIHEAITFAKPILCIPFFGDQHHNTQNVIDRGIGLGIDKLNFTADEIVIKMKTILHSETFKKNLEKMKNIMKLGGGCNAAIKAIEEALLGTDHLNVPYLKVKWWEHLALDVYLLFLLILISMYIFGKCIFYSLKNTGRRKFK